MSESKAEEGAVSEDTLLDGRVKLAQPAKGYRVAIDPIFLAAAVDAAGDDSVLDVGTGVGAAALCLAARLPSLRVTGMEIDGSLVELAKRNAEANRAADRARFIHGDILDAGALLEPGSFDHVIANPPYHKPGSGNPSVHPGKAAANVEGAARLDDWIGFCVGMVRPKGSVTFIHHAERLDEVLGHMLGHLGEIVIFPLWPNDGVKPAKRVIVRGRKGVAAPARMAKGMVLHDRDGAYTLEAANVLRDGKGLML